MIPTPPDRYPGRVNTEGSCVRALSDLARLSVYVRTGEMPAAGQGKGREGPSLPPDDAEGQEGQGNGIKGKEGVEG